MSTASNYYSNNNNYQSHSSSQLPYSYEIEDPFIPWQIDNYLSNWNDWRNIQDIIRLCFKSITDTVRTQGMALREIEKALQHKISKTEFNTIISTKANANEVNSAWTNISNSLEQRASTEEVRQLINEKISKNELMYYLNTKPSTDEVKNILDEKLDIESFTSEINDLHLKVDNYHKDISTRISQFALHKDIQAMQMVLDQKADKERTNEELNSKASKDFVLNSLQKKINKVEADSIWNTKADKNEIIALQMLINQKVDIDTIEPWSNELNNKIDKETFESFAENIINNKAEWTDFKLISDAFSENKTSMSKRVDDIDQDLDRLIDNIKTQFQNVNTALTNLDETKADLSVVDQVGAWVNSKPDNEKVYEEGKKWKDEMFEILNAMKNDIVVTQNKHEEKLNEKLNSLTNENKKIMVSIKDNNEHVSSFMQDKQNELLYDRSQAQEGLNKWRHEISEIKATVSYLNEAYNKGWNTNNNNNNNILNKITEKKDIETLENMITTNHNQMNKKIMETFNRVHDELSLKINKNELNWLLADKANTAQWDNKLNIEEYLKLKQEVSVWRNEWTDKAEIIKMESSWKALHWGVEELFKTMNMKANMKDIISSLKYKADIEDMNKALRVIHKELDTKSAVDVFTTAMDNQALINDALCAQNCIGRWWWKSGKVKNGIIIPWEIQSVNTAPDTFIWEEDRSCICVMEQGWYEWTMGVYSDKKPTVQVMINGEVAIIASNNSSNIVHQAIVGKGKGQKNLWGNVTGLSLVDYLVLPGKAKVSVSWTGETPVNGFIGLKKL